MKTRDNNTGRTARAVLWISAMSAVVVLMLAVGNWLPSLIRQDFPKRYGSIEEAGRFLGLDGILVPAYFPEGITWPPSLILAQKRPFKAVAMEFREAQSTETVMVVIQSSSPHGYRQLQRITLSEIREETEYMLKGKTAVLHTGDCDNGKPCSAMTWQDGDIYCRVLLISPPFELIRIADSMVR